VNLRRLGGDDAAALRALRLEAFAAHPRDFRSSPEEEAAIPLAELAATLERDLVMGLVDGEALAGAAGLRFDPRAKRRHRGEIWGVYVRPAARGQGHAEALLRALIAAAAEQGAERLTLIASEGNRAALRLYTRLGFSAYAFDPRALRLDDGTWVEERLMARTLR
jgi:ribosomal protein S18 acetylase RimI-like enzyme